MNINIVNNIIKCCKLTTTIKLVNVGGVTSLIALYELSHRVDRPINQILIESCKIGDIDTVIGAIQLGANDWYNAMYYAGMSGYETIVDTVHDCTPIVDRPSILLRGLIGVDIGLASECIYHTMMREHILLKLYKYQLNKDEYQYPIVNI